MEALSSWHFIEGLDSIVLNLNVRILQVMADSLNLLGSGGGLA